MKNAKVGERVCQYVGSTKVRIVGTVAEIIGDRYCFVKFDKSLGQYREHESTLIRLKKKPKLLRVEFEGRIRLREDDRNWPAITQIDEGVSVVAARIEKSGLIGKRVRVRVEALE